MKRFEESRFVWRAPLTSCFISNARAMNNLSDSQMMVGHGQMCPTCTCCKACGRRSKEAQTLYNHDGGHRIATSREMLISTCCTVWTTFTLDHTQRFAPFLVISSRHKPTACMAPRAISIPVNNCTPIKCLLSEFAARNTAPAIGGPNRFAILDTL